MTPAQRELFFALAEQWMRVAVEACNAATTMRLVGLPIERCEDAMKIERNAIELSTKIEELARDAAPMTERRP